MWKSSYIQDESTVSSSKRINKASSSNNSLERSLLPLWRLTYYGGLLFDWRCPIPRQSCITASFRCIVIAVGILANVFQTVTCVAQFYKVIQSNSSIQQLIYLSIEVTYQLVILITWIHFLRRRQSISMFLSDFGKNQQHFEAITERQVINGVYFMFGFFGAVFLIFNLIYAFKWNGNTDDFFISYYPSLSENLVYIWWCRFAVVVEGFSVGLFYALLDIVPVMVYYHGSKLIQAINFELENLNNIYDKNNICEGLEGVWFRFENLRVLLQRADELFGSLMLLSHGQSFFGICTSLYSFLNYVKRPVIATSLDQMQMVDDENDRIWMYFSCFNFCFHLIRIVVGVLLISKVACSSNELLSTAAFLSLRRCRFSENNKEERRIMKSFIGRLENNQLAACPSGLYTIKTSILLTMLGLIVSYTIILLQSNNDSPQKST